MTKENVQDDNKFNIFERSIMNDIGFYEETYNLWGNSLINHKDSEPLKIFKKKHREWEEKLELLQNKYDSAYDKFLNKIDDLYEFNNIPTKRNKNLKN